MCQTGFVFRFGILSYFQSFRSAPFLAQPVAGELPIAIHSNCRAAQVQRNFFRRQSLEHFHLNDRPNGRLDRFQPRENILSIDLFQQLRVTRLQNSSSLVFSRELQRWLDRQTAKHGRSLHVPTRILQVAYLQAGPYLTAIFRLEK
jgi:hypothetical protein